MPTPAGRSLTPARKGRVDDLGVAAGQCDGFRAKPDRRPPTREVISVERGERALRGTRHLGGGRGAPTALSAPGGCGDPAIGPIGPGLGRRAAAGADRDDAGSCPPLGACATAVGHPAVTDYLPVALALSEGQRDGWTVLEVGGEVDAYTAPQLSDALAGLIDAGAGRVLVDLGGVDFMDSTGLGALVVALKRLREVEGEMRLTNARTNVAKVFEITGITQVFGLSSSTGDAGP